MNPTTIDMVQIKESMRLITTALNKSCKVGAFTMDEAHLIKISTLNIEKLIDVFEHLIEETKKTSTS